MAPHTRGPEPRTRVEELAAENLHTVLSTRDYRCDALAFACVWARGDTPRWTLEDLNAALRRPVFAAYLGRKSCVPALPFQPGIVEAADPVAALRAVAKDDDFLQGLPTGSTQSFHWEGPRGEATQTVLRRDEVSNRGRWQFIEREEHVLVEERDRVSDPDPASA